MLRAIACSVFRWCNRIQFNAWQLKAWPQIRVSIRDLWTQRGRQISEYAIGVDVLGRQPDFESKTDASVRVAVARLRGKLKEFYEEESQFPLRVTIPRGSHELKWSYEPPSEMEPAPQAKRAFPAGGVSIALAVALLGWALAALYIENRTLKASVASLPAPAPLPRFWRSFLSGARPVVVSVPNPLYLVWPNRIHTRDLKVSRFADWPSSPFFADLAKHWGEPTPSQTYVGAVEMLAATRLVQYLERSGQQVELVGSSRFSADAFASQNTISLGMPRTAAYLDRLLERTNFYLAQVRAGYCAESKSPSRRSLGICAAAFLRRTRDSSWDPDLFVGKARKNPLSSTDWEYPNGMTPLMISVEGLKQIEEQWVKGGSPEGWEMVIKAEILRDTALKAWPVAFRAIPADFWK